MAERLAPGEYDRLHHFVAAGVWNAAPLEAELLVQANRLVGGDEAVLVIDDTALPKKGNASVGVAPQYASALGKNANCQTLVSVTLASGEVPLMVGLRLFLPDSWTSDPARMKRARVPSDRQAFRSKPEIAIDEIDRVRAAGVRFGCVLADAGYGLSAPFRHALSERGLRWAVGIPRHQKVYPVDVALVFPVAGRGRPRQRHIPDSKSIAAEATRVKNIVGIRPLMAAIRAYVRPFTTLSAATTPPGATQHRTRIAFGRKSTTIARNDHIAAYPPGREP
jgi:SRSO17 transposase